MCKWGDENAHVRMNNISATMLVENEIYTFKRIVFVVQCYLGPSPIDGRCVECQQIRFPSILLMHISNSREPSISLKTSHRSPVYIASLTQ